MPRDRDRESGQYRETVIDDEILAFIQNHDRPFVTTGDILDRFDLSRTHANDRLNQLAEDTRLQRTVVGARAVVWWLADDE